MNRGRRRFRVPRLAALRTAPVLALVALSMAAEQRGQAKVATAPARPQITFTRDVAPILQRSCQSCHRSDSSAPIALLTYDDVRPWAKAIKAKVVAREMPLWFIDRRMGVRRFKGDPSLSEDEIATIVGWVDGGAPRGDPADMPPPSRFDAVDEWHIGKPDVIVSMPTEHIVSAGQPDQWVDYVVDPGLTEDRYLEAVETRPANGARAAVHHAMTYLIAGDDDRGEQSFLSQYAPGKNGETFQAGTGRLLTAGVKIRFNMHYHAVGREVRDRTSVALKFYPRGVVPEHVQRTAMVGGLNEELDIPAGEGDVRHDGYFKLEHATRITSFQPHMHDRGKAMCIEAILPDMRIEPLSCARFRADWHLTYDYADDAAPLLPAGTILHVTAWHDNSAANKANPDPRNWVGLGGRAGDEMSFAWVNYYDLSDDEFTREVEARGTHPPARPSASRAAAQIQYAVGQNVVPVYEGWERNPDGTFTMTFGYMNRNYEEEPHVPVGSNNFFEPGPADRGQPTHFYSRRQMFVFKVVVAADWGKKDLVWTLTANGRTDRAYGSLLPVWELSDVVIRENRIQDMGRGGGEPNLPPRIALEGDSRRTITLGETVSLTVSVSDDGFPTPRPVRAGPRGPARIPKPNVTTQAVVKADPTKGLGVTWIHYRGAGIVTFEPMTPSITNGKATTQATFSEPGTYVVRAYADDSVLTAEADVTVIVNPRR